MFIFVPVEVDGKTEFQRHTRYDISQTNVQITDFPNRIRDYTLDENKEILERYLGMPTTDFKDYFRNEAEKVFSNSPNLTDEIKIIHTQLTQHVVTKYFGIDTTAEIKPAIDKWLELNQASQQKIKIIDLVHFEAQKIIKEIENELAFPKIMTKQTNAKKTNQTPNTQEIPQQPTSNNTETKFSFDKLKKDLGFDQSENTLKKEVTLEESNYKQSQGIYNFINFLDKVESEHANLIKSKSSSSRMKNLNGNTYDTLLRATYAVGGLKFEFNQDENVLKVYGSDQKFDILDGDLPEAFDDFKEQVLNEINQLKSKELESEKKQAKEANINAPPKPKRHLDTEEINRADGINLVQFIENNGIDLKSVGRGRYHSKQYSSLVVLSSNNKFYHNATGASGGPIAFAQKMLGIKHFVDAVNYINNGEYDQAKYVEVERGDYIYDRTKESSDFSKAHNYLVNERKIDVAIVNGLHQRKGLIHQDIYGNVLFPFIENNEIVGCAVRQTMPNEKFPKQRTQLWSAEFRDWNFLNGEPKNLKFFEDPIDALSYMDTPQATIKNRAKRHVVYCPTWFSH